ncbi:DUF1573 domain-containing protein [Pseudenhygromyxa sp. WMMC2535]|uniref:DUF1573 domain-containing protein n=1 Tax=Pseudenhygromyxa sp. WMMC2535 TaxID=2712867 RepID=UPI001554D058|nr:DUF1573 domain-containing protein [Pseudenhygromyxa sp. WMMC2535]NVB43093.1 DUF1573 domain-containing protein [Pseudenhygromyxa sp. WMMC2535]
MRRVLRTFGPATLLLAGLGCNTSAPPEGAPLPEAAAPVEAEAGAAQEAGEVEGAPKISCGEGTFDFGSLAPGGSATHVFTIENVGTADLHIERVKRTCGCTATVLADKLVPPGGKTEIEVTLKPKGSQQHVHKTVTVISDDPEQPSFPLTMQGELLVDAVAKPARLTLNNLRPKAEGVSRFQIDIRTESTQIESVKVLDDQEHFSVHALEDGRYELRFSGSERVRSFTSRIEVETTGVNTPQLIIPVRATVASNLRYGKRIQFARDEAGNIPARTIRFSGRDGVAPKIGKIEDPDGLLELKVLESKGAMATIEARVNPDKLEAMDVAKRGLGHPLFVHTNDPDEPRVELGYSIRGVTPPRPHPDLEQANAKGE